MYLKYEAYPLYVINNRHQESPLIGFSKYNAALMKFSVESVIINWKGVGTSPLMSIILAVLLLSVFISVSTIELALFWCLLINLNDSLIKLSRCF